MDLIAKAEHELTELSRQIAAMQQRQDALKSFIAIGRSLVEDDEQTAAPAPWLNAATPAVSGIVTTPPGFFDRPPSIKQHVLKLAEETISKTGPQSTRALVEHLERHGISVGGADKVLAVSTILSRAKGRFKSDRAAGGWTLVDGEKEETPQGASTPAGSDVESQPVPEQGAPERQPVDMT